jgi:hypothetical protein
MRVLRVLAPLAVVCGALFAVSCGGNSSVSTATSYPTSAADVVTLSQTAGTLPLPAVSPGNSVTLNYVGSSVALPSPFPSAGITLNTTQLSAPPTNAPAPTSKNRSILSRSNAVAVTSLTFTTNYALPFGAFNSETLNLATSLPVNQAYFVEIDDLTTGLYINTFPGSAVSSGQVTFTNASGFLPTSAITTYNTTDTYLMQFYYLASGTPATPTPSPSPAGSASPNPTPTPVVVSTSVPLGAATTVPLPVVAGGFVANVSVPAAGSSATTLTLSGASTLPTGITTVGTNDYPYYILGLSANGSTAFASPGFTVQLPSNFSDATSEIFGALCTVTACPVDANDAAVSPMSTTNGIVTFAAGAFPGFTGVSPTTQYLIVYTSRGTPSGQSTSVPFPANAAGSITVPSISSNLGTYASTVNLSGLGSATTVTVAAQTGLFPSITAIVPNTQTIFYALQLNASPQVTAPGLACGTTNCNSIVLTIPSALVTAAENANFYVEECSATACPLSTSDVLALAPPASNTLVVPPTFGTDITSLYPSGSANTSYLVFYYK